MRLIAYRTPSGAHRIGHARTPLELLIPGDVLETEVQGTGVLRNRSAAWQRVGLLIRDATAIGGREVTEGKP